MFQGFLRQAIAARSTTLCTSLSIYLSPYFILVQGSCYGSSNSIAICITQQFYTQPKLQIYPIIVICLSLKPMCLIHGKYCSTIFFQNNGNLSKSVRVAGYKGSAGIYRSIMDGLFNLFYEQPQLSLFASVLFVMDQCMRCLISDMLILFLLLSMQSLKVMIFTLDLSYGIEVGFFLVRPLNRSYFDSSVVWLSLVFYQSSMCSVELIFGMIFSTQFLNIFRFFLMHFANLFMMTVGVAGLISAKCLMNIPSDISLRPIPSCFDKLGSYSPSSTFLLTKFLVYFKKESYVLKLRALFKMMQQLFTSICPRVSLQALTSEKALNFDFQ